MDYAPMSLERSRAMGRLAGLVMLTLGAVAAHQACASESPLAAQAAAKGECVFVDEEVDGAGKVVRVTARTFSKCQPGDPPGTTYLRKTSAFPPKGAPRRAPITEKILPTAPSGA